MEVSLVDKFSTKEAWYSIAMARISVDHVHRAMLQRLRKECKNLTFCLGEQIEDFTLRLTMLKQ
jgi:hypothetical protein